jgi:hypothetical protein
MINIVFECPHCDEGDLKNWTDAGIVVCCSCGWSGPGWAPLEDDDMAVDDPVLGPKEILSNG